jgi:hypothetical protein
VAKTKFRSLMLAALLLLPCACASIQMQVPTLAPRYTLPKTDLKVAILPFGDGRTFTNEARSLWYLVPLIPFSTATYDRRDEDYVGSADQQHFTHQVALALAQQLAAAGLFAKVGASESSSIDPTQWNLIITGQIKASTRTERRTLYGLTVAGLALWLCGLPIGWDEVHWELTLELRDAASNTVYKTIDVEQTQKRWLGLYWGANGFPQDEAALLGQVTGTLIAQIDAALDQVPALAALTPPPPAKVAPGVRYALDTLVVMANGVLPQVSNPFVEIVLAEIQKRCSGKVLGLADLDALLAVEKVKDQLSCTEVDCLAELAGAVNANALLVLSFGVLGDQQTLSAKVLDPRNNLVLSRTTWMAAGSDPRAFIGRLPDILATALAPFAKP